MVPQAAIVPSGDGGHWPDGAGWFVLNTFDAQWLDGPFGPYTRFESPHARFDEIGVNIGVLQPGMPACMYHGEDRQENFLVLSGEAILIVEGQERTLTAWDFVHCPPWTEHVIVGAGDGPCVILALGGRGDATIYPVSPVAARHGASVAETTDSPAVAYADFPQSHPTSVRRDWFRGLGPS